MKLEGGGALKSLLGPLVVCLGLPVTSLAAGPPDRPSPVLIEEMTTTEVRDAIRTGKTTVLVFSASTEETGAHVVLGKHIFRTRYLGERIARDLGNALVAPVQPFAPTNDDLRRFPGTVHLSPEVFALVNEEVVASLVKSGFHDVILMGDHGGNQEPLEKLARKLDAEYRSRGVRVFYSSDAFDKSNEEINEYLRSRGYPRSGHGGIAETSEIWTVDERSVRPGRIAIGEPMPNDPDAPMSLGATGIAGDPRRSSAALGRKFLDIRVRNGADQIRRLISQSGASR